MAESPESILSSENEREVVLDAESISPLEYNEDEARMSGEATYLSPATDGFTFDENQEKMSNDEVKWPPDCLSKLGRSAYGITQVFLTLKVQGRELQNVLFLKDLTNLQTVSVANNCLTDLKGIERLHHLTHLNASHNSIQCVGEMSTALRHLDLSYNQLDTIPDLSQYQSLATLILDGNQINSITGIKNCHSLRHLSLSCNQISTMANLDNLRISHLDLSSNCIKKIDGLLTLKSLQHLNLSSNQIRSLRGLQSCRILHTILLAMNEIIDISEVRYIRDLRLLRTIDLENNPIQSMPDYRLSLLHHLPRLISLDASSITSQEKVASENLLNPSKELVAARNHAVNLLQSYEQPISLLNSTLPSLAAPYPILILTGPTGSGKRSLVRRLCTEFSDVFQEGISHTTRGLRESVDDPCCAEMDGRDYYFVTKDQFEAEKNQGKYIETCQVNGFMYAFSRNVIENIAEDHMTCVTHMEIEGVMEMKKKHYTPRYVLILPGTADGHRRTLRERKSLTEHQIQQAQQRVSLYETMNRDYPGYFDCVICEDEPDAAYNQLRTIISDFMGLVDDIPPSSHFQASNAKISLSSNASVFSLFNASSASFYNEGTPNNLQRERSIVGAISKSPVEKASHERRFRHLKQLASGRQTTSEEQLALIRAPVSHTGLSTGYLSDDNGFINRRGTASAPAKTFDSFSLGLESTQTILDTTAA